MIDTKVFKLKMDRGKGTNTSGELLALWCLLYFAGKKQVSHLQICGDSKVAIDWMARKCKLQVANLEGWQRKVANILSKSTQMDNQHIYREYNKDVNDLSKQALTLEEGKIFVFEYLTDYLVLDFVISVLLTNPLIRILKI